MAKYWVSLTKRAGVEVEAKGILDAMNKAEETNEELYETLRSDIDGRLWEAENAELIEED